MTDTKAGELAEVIARARSTVAGEWHKDEVSIPAGELNRLCDAAERAERLAAVAVCQRCGGVGSTHMDHPCPSCKGAGNLAARVAQLKAELAEAKADAERWRLLREHATDNWLRVLSADGHDDEYEFRWHGRAYIGRTLDEAIDAARSKS